MKTTTPPVALFQRNGRKAWTIVQGLQKQFDSDRILRVLKKQLACNGKLVDDGLGQVVQLSGDQRAKVAEFLIKEGIANKEDIHIHGF
ncbi:translation initiation factor SUI1 [Lichtheimia ornata]|uniref:Translation initiation factor SUI1 n=1 Tax=Lichtheimia ornata TaxID=688661 RepID=A0AAD7VAN8_9FUNG|nr:translation initiation factor SUI1 [Lichtheimia ornata]KAJ8662142.1 translation initiation factor SUI1 [Lichtheimia ornata]